MFFIPSPPGGSTFQTAFSAANPLKTAGLASNTTIVCKYRPGIIQTAGNTCKITVQSPATGSSVISDMFIGVTATSGNTWSFATTPVRVTWNGGLSSVTLDRSDGLRTASDEIQFAINDTDAINIAMNVASGSEAVYTGSLGPNCVSYTRPATSEAGTVVKGVAYTTVGGTSYVVSRIEVAP